MAGTNPTFANELLALVFQGTALSPGGVNLAINATSSPATNLYVSLHTADPTTGNQTTSEVAYTSYARVAVARSSSGWTISSNVVDPAATVTFPAGTGGSGTAAYWAVGVAASSTGALLWAGAISPTITCGSGITPALQTGTSITVN